MVKKMTPGRADIELFVECLFNQYSHILLREEHITRTDKLKGYREYENGDEVKRELADMLERFVTKYESNDYVRDVRFHASNKEGLSNYIDVTFNTPFGAKEWLKHMSIRASDHYQRKGREKKKVDEYIDLTGKSVADIEKDLDRIINKRIRRLEREFNMPKAQNESIRRNKNMKLIINENLSPLDSKSKYKLKMLLNKFFHGDKGYYQNRPWKIAEGAYDLVAEIYLDKLPVCDIIYTPYGYQINNLNYIDVSTAVADILKSMKMEVVERN